MRIGLVSVHDARDARMWSGIPFQVLNHLLKLGVEVEVFSPLQAKSKYLLAPWKAMAKMQRTSLSLDHFLLVQADYAHQLRKRMRERPVDVVVSLSTIPVARLKCDVPIVTWTDAVFHAMHRYYGGAFSNQSAAALARARRQEQAALENGTFAAYASHWACAGARELVREEKLRVIPFGASLPITHTEADIVRSAKQKSAQRPRRCELLFVGFDWKRKGGEVAVEVAQQLNDAGLPTRLRVVGYSPEHAYPGFVCFEGAVDKSSEAGVARLAALYRDADFFLLPTRSEAAGIVFCEASAFGVPSLSYDTGGVSDYVRNGVNGACLPSSAAAGDFAALIRTWFEDPAAYEALSVGAFREYESRLNWTASVRALIALCQEAQTLSSNKPAA